ncbi:peptidylprolyl isomerase [Deinococcus lacus]|uniref:Peptidylprolyl isomerase n=1 Tax=Deinococcus lacus TaxID=392561 RepID=A0ABW1YFU3_9DEIO
MKNAAYILTALLTLTACQEQTKTETTAVTKTNTATTEPAEQATETGTTPPATDTQSTEAATTETATTEPATSGTAEGTETPASSAAAGSEAVTQPGPIPAGYTEVKPLSAEPKREFAGPPALSLEQGKDYYALLDTSRGQVLVDLFEQETPITVNNFVDLARHHFYDQTRFHRVIDGFMAQAGDPLSADEGKKAAWGTGGPGYTFGDEIRQKLTFDSPGLLAMANSGAGPDGTGTNGSQFFITFGPTDFLNGRHTIFGKVVQGEAEVLPKLTRTADSSMGGETPVEGAVPDELLSVRILTK